MSTEIIEWIGNCEKCGCNKIEITGQCVTQTFVTVFSNAKCTDCGSIGHVEIYGNEECIVSWDE